MHILISRIFLVVENIHDKNIRIKKSILYTLKTEVHNDYCGIYINIYIYVYVYVYTIGQNGGNIWQFLQVDVIYFFSYVIHT